MSVTIKVLFGEKLYRLAPGVQTLEQVEKQMRQRFPEIRQLRYYHDDQEIKDLSTLLAQIRKQGKTSLKLTAKAENAEIEALSSCSISKINQSIPEMKSEVSQIFDIIPETLPQSKESQKKAVKEQENGQVKVTFTLPSDFYVCFNCSGQGITQESSSLALCTICKGKGKFDDSHRYVKRMKELYTKHFSSEEKKEQIVECPKEIQPVRKSSIFGMDKSYDVIISEVNKKDKVELNKLFTVRFQIRNQGQDWTQDNIQVIECGSTEGRRVSALKKGDKMVIELGPFVCKNESILEKTYSLCYTEGKELIRFGHKFGFSVKGMKKEEIKKNDRLLQEKERIQDLKKMSGSNKSEEYLGMKLKSLGIDIMDLQMDEELLFELIRQMN